MCFVTSQCVARDLFLAEHRSTYMGVELWHSTAIEEKDHLDFPSAKSLFCKVNITEFEL